MEKTFIEEKDRKKVVEVLEAKRALLFKWINAIDKLKEAVVNEEDSDRFLDDWQTDDEVTHGFAYIVGCIDEDENGISVFPNYRGQVTLHKYEDGSWG